MLYRWDAMRKLKNGCADLASAAPSYPNSNCADLLSFVHSSRSDLEVGSVLLQLAVVHVHGEKLRETHFKSIISIFPRQASKAVDGEC